jgi:hypothetical protein
MAHPHVNLPRSEVPEHGRTRLRSTRNDGIDCNGPRDLFARGSEKIHSRRGLRITDATPSVCTLSRAPAANNAFRHICNT